MKMKSSLPPAVIIGSLLGLVVLVLGLLQFTISIEPIEPETSSLSKTVPPRPNLPSGAPLSSIRSQPTPVSKPSTPVEQDTPPVSSSAPVGKRTARGALRISNKTDQPVRVALLAQSSASKAVDGQPNYGKPAHCDFAPGEGSGKGLILSLPEGNLKLNKGDILVAFAQDGSGRYWGPFVVGETASPIWNRQTSEWELILQP